MVNMTSPLYNNTSKESGMNEDPSINFRPSPNFKHMKKYLKSKFEEDMIAGMLAIEEGEKKLSEIEVQPPLPPYSPPPYSSPPDSPASFMDDLEDDHVVAFPAAAAAAPDAAHDAAVASAAASTTASATLAPSGPAGAANDIAAAESPDKKPQKPVMCKDFVRKTCLRGSACIYAHEIDLKQLKGVYNFCRDYENDRCNRPVCYFVHATTFEKEHFFRTATLPPHTLAHLARAQPKIEAPAEIPAMPNPQIQSLPCGTMALPCGSLPPLGPDAPVTAALKREWPLSFSSPPSELEPNEPDHKKCKCCDLTELSLQSSETALTQARRMGLEMDGMLEALVLLHSRTLSQLRARFKPKRDRIGVAAVGGSAGVGFPSLRRAVENSGKELRLAQMEMLLAKIMQNGCSPSDDS